MTTAPAKLEVPAVNPMMRADEKIGKALMFLVVHKPFYGSLITKLDVRAHRGIKTCSTDGRYLLYNPAWVERLPFGPLLTVLAHEVMHCALLHPYRRGERDVKLWNEACDHAVNLLLQEEEEGFEFPGQEFGAYCADPRFKEQSAEQIYSTLLLEQPPQPPQPQQQAGGQGEGEGQSKPQPGDDDSDDDQQSSGAGPGNGEPDDDSESDGEQQSSDDQSDQGEEGEQEQGDGSDGEQEQDPDAEQEEEGDGDGEGEPKDGEQSPDSKQPPQDQQQQQASDGDEQQGDGPKAPPQSEQPGSSMGDVMDGSGSEAEQTSAEEDWSAAVAAAAMQAEMAGHLSANAVREIRKQFEPQTDFSDYVRMFVARISREDRSWSRPDRRSQAVGAYLPSMRTEAVGKLVIGIDTSGSIRDRELATFEAEFRAIHADLKPEELIVVYCDAEVCAEERVGPYDEVRFGQPKGGGGTDFRPVFDRIKQLQEEGEQVAGLIYLTDLDGDYPEVDEVDPDLPVLWVGTTTRITPEFGEVTRLRVGR